MKEYVLISTKSENVCSFLFSFLICYMKSSCLLQRVEPVAQIHAVLSLQSQPFRWTFELAFWPKVQQLKLHEPLY